MICRALWVCKVFLYDRLTLILETKHRTRHKASSSVTLWISSTRDLKKQTSYPPAVIGFSALAKDWLSLSNRFVSAAP
jgi:hypothetical protein